MLHTDRSRLMMLMTVAALTLWGGGAYLRMKTSPRTTCPIRTKPPHRGENFRGKNMGSTERHRDR